MLQAILHVFNYAIYKWLLQCYLEVPVAAFVPGKMQPTHVSSAEWNFYFW